jgi:Protein of unknown function (DUF2934)
MRNDTKRPTNTTPIVPLESGPESLRAEEDEIRIRAYELFLERNCELGHADDDWFRAESEIRKRGDAVSLKGRVAIPGPEGAR